MSALLRAEHLSKNFGGLAAVRDVSFDVQKGEIVGIIGPNGSGKSTLFNLLSRHYPLSQGRVWFDGLELTRLPTHCCSRVGLARTFQIPSPFTRMSVLENLLAVYRPEPLEVMRQRAKEILRRLQLERLESEPASSCSGGQLKLLEIGRALMTRPKLLLLDECVAGVNPVLRVQIIELLKRLRAEGLTILLIEHDMDWVQKLCDRLLVMHHGELIASGTFEQVTQNPIVLEAYLGR